MATKEQAPEKTETKSEAKIGYFKSIHASGLTILKKDGTSERFTSYFDTYKGDKVRVGYLETSDPEVISRCKSLNIVEELTGAEYKKELDALKKSPLFNE